MKKLLAFFAHKKTTVPLQVTPEAETDGTDAEIIRLANQLADAIQRSGRLIAHPSIAKGFGSFDFRIHRL